MIDAASKICRWLKIFSSESDKDFKFKPQIFYLIIQFSDKNICMQRRVAPLKKTKFISDHYFLGYTLLELFPPYGARRASVCRLSLSPRWYPPPSRFVAACRVGVIPRDFWFSCLLSCFWHGFQISRLFPEFSKIPVKCASKPENGSEVWWRRAGTRTGRRLLGLYYEIEIKLKILT